MNKPNNSRFEIQPRPERASAPASEQEDNPYIGLTPEERRKRFSEDMKSDMEDGDFFEIREASQEDGSKRTVSYLGLAGGHLLIHDRVEHPQDKQ